MSDRERLAELERQWQAIRNRNYWNAHMGSSARSYHPPPVALLDEITLLRRRLGR